MAPPCFMNLMYFVSLGLRGNKKNLSRMYTYVVNKLPKLTTFQVFNTSRFFPQVNEYLPTPCELFKFLTSLLFIGLLVRHTTRYISSKMCPSFYFSKNQQQFHRKSIFINLALMCTFPLNYLLNSQILDRYNITRSCKCRT